MIQSKIASINNGAILFDSSRYGSFSSDYFEPDFWHKRNWIEDEATGRGSTLMVRFHEESWVLRHYLRGGLYGKFVKDGYLWSGARRTRCFREWQLLADLFVQDMPVPRPVAARYIRTGSYYTADLITEKLPNLVTLAKLLEDHELSSETWSQVGSCVRRFHEAGVFHADLNAHNIMLTKDGEDIHIIDFDRGHFRPGNAWKQRNLDRLKRSLEKVTRDLQWGFDQQQWNYLLGGYSL